MKGLAPVGRAAAERGPGSEGAISRTWKNLADGRLIPLKDDRSSRG